MASYVAPKNDWTAADGMTYVEQNKVADSIIADHATIVANKATTDAHAADTTIHKTSSTIRAETGELRVNVRTNDPVGLAAGQIWLRSDL